jgi:hypothetical protein
LFSVWFGENIQILAVVTGSLGVVLGLGLMWTLVAILVGNLVVSIQVGAHGYGRGRCVTAFGRVSGGGGDGWQPRAPGERVAQGGKDAGVVLGGG